MYSFFHISFPGSTHVSGRKCHISAQTSDFSWTEVSWFCTVVNMLEEILHQCHSVKALVRDDSVGQVLQVLPLLHLALWLLRDVCYIDEGLLPLSVSW